MRIHHLRQHKCERHESHRGRGGHGRHEQSHPEGRARHRRERLFDANDIRLLILHLLAGGPAHGYELIKSIESLAKGEYVPSPGIIYPNLTLMEEMGFITVGEGQSGKKSFTLTEEGKASLAQQQSELEAVTTRLATLGVLGDNRRLPEVQRAIHNFKTALHAKLGQH
ncbi:Transcriptional regulator YqjI [Cedecea neteri]|uniref:Transcriptional regulator YqjI n=1 Tax=Cedecea neteri TaxID=158822 RepID=A0A2X3IMV7_9ENTR|nr:Transcriptional regulator YqjI [Cedecea neteri]